MRYIAISINVGIYVTRPNVQLGRCKYCIIAFIISWLSVSHAGIKPKRRLALWYFDRKVSSWPSLVHFKGYNPYAFASIVLMKTALAQINSIPVLWWTYFFPTGNLEEKSWAVIPDFLTMTSCKSRKLTNKYNYGTVNSLEDRNLWDSH